jgi:AraC-like DNA-binding protein
MNPILMRHVEAISESFKAWENSNPYLHNPWHYHPECEITFISKGKGILFIGDKVLNYKENELVFIGPNLPHEWRSLFKDSADFHSQSFAIHFKKELFGQEFYKIPELEAINELLKTSTRGLKINSTKTKKNVKQKLHSLLNSTGLERITILLSILNEIAISSNAEFLSSPIFVSSIEEDHNQRMNQIYKYVMTHFKHKFSIEEIAGEVCLTPTSFCRFFAKRTNKSFIQYVNEIRIAYACKLLYEGACSISQAAFDSGFENLSNFNRQFKKIKGNTPTEFVTCILQSTQKD